MAVLAQGDEARCRELLAAALDAAARWTEHPPLAAVLEGGAVTCSTSPGSPSPPGKLTARKKKTATTDNRATARPVITTDRAVLAARLLGASLTPSAAPSTSRAWTPRTPARPPGRRSARPPSAPRAPPVRRRLDLPERPRPSPRGLIFDLSRSFFNLSTSKTGMGGVQRRRGDARPASGLAATAGSEPTRVARVRSAKLILRFRPGRRENESRPAVRRLRLPAPSWSRSAW